MEKTLTQTLNRLGVRHGLDGRIYLEEAIKARIETPIGKVGDLYNFIGKKYGKKWSCIERSIRHSIYASETTCDKELFEEIIGYPIEKVKPTNSEYIAAVADYVRKANPVRKSWE